MTFETPERVDLSQELSTQEALSTLTADEQTRLQEYLDTEQQRIIYLTQQELGELKNILGEDASASHEADFDEFINNQIEEGFSSQDLVGQIEGNLITPELLETLDGASHDILFDATNGIFKGLEISDTAKDTISVSLTFSLIEDIKLHPEVFTILASDGANIAEMLAENYNEKFGNIPEAFSEYFDISGEAFAIAGEGENNRIFMELNSGKDFFTQIIAGEITKDNVISRITAANTLSTITATPGDINILRNIASFTQEELTTLIASTQDRAPGEAPGDTTGVTVVNPDVPVISNPEAAQTALERLAASGAIGAFLAAILEVLQGLGNNQETPDVTTGTADRTVAEPVVAEEVAPVPTERGREFFRSRISEGSLSSFTANQILEMFPESGELSQEAQRIIQLINTIPDRGDEDSFEEKFENLFSPRESDQAIKFNLFVEASGERLIQEGRPAPANMIAVLEEYSRYRSEGGEGLYTTWFQNTSAPGNTGSE